MAIRSGWDKLFGALMDQPARGTLSPGGSMTFVPAKVTIKLVSMSGWTPGGVCASTKGASASAAPKSQDDNISANNVRFREVQMYNVDKGIATEANEWKRRPINGCVGQGMEECLHHTRRS